MKQHEYNQIELVNIGLPKDEGAIYSLLLKKGAMYASSIAHTTGISRVMTYRALDTLIAKELVKKIEKKGAITQFFPQHPFGLNKLLEEEKKHIENKQKALESIIGELSTEYARLTGEPGVRVLVGVSGYGEMLKDIEQTKGTVYLMRTQHDADSPELLSMIRQHVIRRTNKQIPTKLLSPYIGIYNRTLLDWDRDNLVDRRFINPKVLETAAQVTIYDEKVAIVAYRSGNPIITIIQDPDISSTFLALFEYTWLHTKEYSDSMKEVLSKIAPK